MTLTARQESILSRLRKESEVDVAELALEMDITPQTVRRDLARLCDAGLAQRTHGGARRPLTVSNTGYEDRRLNNAAAKDAIAARVAQLVPDNCSLALNIGTTTEATARALSGHRGLVVLSNNINIARIFAGAPVKELILAGGTVRPEDGAIVGPEAVSFISNYKLDCAIVGASALDEDGAVLDFDRDEVAAARAILANARRKILVCDSSKFARTAPVRICDIGDVDVFVTETPPPLAFQKAAQAAGTEILIAGDKNRDY